MPKTDGLTDKQRRFVEEYPIDFNATQAAIRAGYSEKTAYSIGHENLNKPEIQSAIAERVTKIAEKVEITQERILQEYARIGFSDIRKTLTPGGNLLNPNDWDDDTAAAIAGVEVVTRQLHTDDEDGPKIEYTHKIKTWDKPKALDAMAKHLGMFEGKKGVDDADSDDTIGNDIRSAARDVALLLRRAVQAST